MSASATDLTLIREDSSVYKGAKRYRVLLGGAVIGSVYQSMVTHDRKPPGSRIVTRRTHSLRWFHHAAFRTRRNPGPEETRWRAIASLLGDHFDDVGSHYEELAKLAKVIKGDL